MNISLHMNIYKGKRDGWIGEEEKTTSTSSHLKLFFFFFDKNLSLLLSLSLSLSSLLSSVFLPLQLYLLVDKSKYRLCRKRLVILVSENTCERGERGERGRDPILRSLCFDK